MANNKQNTCNIILAAGKLAARDRATALTQSDSLTLVNGRPVISWIVQSLMETNDGPIILVCNKADNDLINFVNKRWGNNNDIDLILPENTNSILDSLHAGLDKARRENKEASPIRIMLGDTILLNTNDFQPDAIYVSDFDHDSRSWCVVPRDSSPSTLTFHDKIAHLSSPEYKALVGRYEFSDQGLLRQALAKALKDSEVEMSVVLSRYNAEKPLELIDVDSNNWIDCGHLEGIVSAKQKLVISRHFNSFEIDPVLPIITKKSTDQTKLAQEMFWYENIPYELQSLTPRILVNADDHLTMEYYGYGNLAEKFIYYDLPHNFWAYVLERLFKLVKLFEQQFQENLDIYKPSLQHIDFDNIYQHKMLERIEILKSQNSFWAQIFTCDHIEINGISYVGIPKILPELIARIHELKQTAITSIVHGDLCFNNILFDIQSGVIKLIDPRGKFGTNSNTILGDSRYDLAKIRHSYCGDYDSLIERDFTLKKIASDQFIFNTNKERQHERENLFDFLAEKYEYRIKDIRLIEALHFLTMIPLHEDSMDRQMAMFLTATNKLNKELIKDE